MKFKRNSLTAAEDMRDTLISLWSVCRNISVN